MSLCGSSSQQRPGPDYVTGLPVRGSSGLSPKKETNQEREKQADQGNERLPPSLIYSSVGGWRCWHAAHRKADQSSSSLLPGSQGTGKNKTAQWCKHTEAAGGRAGREGAGKGHLAQNERELLGMSCLPALAQSKKVKRRRWRPSTQAGGTAHAKPHSPYLDLLSSHYQKTTCMGQSEIIVGRVFALHTASQVQSQAAHRVP